MNTLPESAMRTIADQAQQDEVLRRIFLEHFDLPTQDNLIEIGDMAERQAKAGYRAWGMMGIEVALAMANMIISMRKPEAGRGLRVMQDLTYALNANDFWAKNAPILVPVLTVAINAHKDGVALKVDAKNNGEYTVYDKLTSASSLVPLEIFSMILYLVGGPMLMSNRSLPLKIALAPYLT